MNHNIAAGIIAGGMIISSLIYYNAPSDCMKNAKEVMEWYVAADGTADRDYYARKVIGCMLK
jgi:hypothetical protein